MIKKIFLFLLFFLIAFHSSSRLTSAKCSPNGGTRCNSNGDVEFCDDGIQWIFFQDCHYGCTSGSCNSPPPAATATTKPTATPTVKPSCSANGITCSINSQCCSSHCVTGICVANCSANGITCSINSQCCSGICSGICQPKPTSTPPAATSTPPTPTPVPCTTCGQSTMVCTYVCDTCTPGKTTGYKDISCWASQACKVNNQDPCFTWNNVAAPVSQCPNTCAGVTPIPSSPPAVPSCQVWTCWDMGTAQCSVGFPRCPGGVGYCDNCGTDCGTCSGAPPGSTPVPTLPDCIENCFDPNISPCITTTCDDEFCRGNCDQWCSGIKTNDCACAANLCSSQTCTGSCGDDCTGLLNCAPTTLERFEIRRWDPIWSYTDSNVNGRDITDAQNRLHICDSFLSGESPHPRSVVYVAWLNNLNGCGDIDPNSVKMKWLGNNAEIAMTKLASYQSGPCAYTATVTYPTDTNIPSAQGFQITMKSISGGVTTPWTTVTPDLKLKVWNCQVPVSGNFYNAGANNLTCIGGGVFSNLFTGLGANSMIFKDMSPIGTPNIADVTANVSNTSYNASLLWNHTYQPIFNGGPDPNQGLKVLNRLFRGYDTGNPTPVLTCPVPDSFSQMSIVSGHEIVHPYWASPAMQLDMAFSQAMEAWFQIRGSGLRAGSNLRSGVPVTAVNQALTMGVTDKDNGLVIYNTLLGNINGNNGNNTFGYPNNWKLSGKNYKDLLNNYNYFYNNLFLKKGIGTTGNSWSQRPTGGIFFVSGDLNIDSDNTSSVNNPLLVVAKGDVNVESTVNQLNLLLMADGNINIGGTSNSQLIVNGSLYARGDIIISRDIGDIVYNTTNPAVRIDYQPTAIFSLDKEIYKVLSDWRSE